MSKNRKQPEKSGIPSIIDFIIELPMFDNLKSIGRLYVASVKI